MLKEQEKLPMVDRQPALRVMPMPLDLNPNGDVFGGWIMSMVDIAGGIEAKRVTRGRVVTVAVTSFTFKQPVSVGDVVSFYTKIATVGHTSVTINVEVLAERNPEAPFVVKVTEATLVYVALDNHGHKTPYRLICDMSYMLHECSESRMAQIAELLLLDYCCSSWARNLRQQILYV